MEKEDDFETIEKPSITEKKHLPRLLPEREGPFVWIRVSHSEFGFPIKFYYTTTTDAYDLAEEARCSGEY
jgi:hypothetical protein